MVRKKYIVLVANNSNPRKYSTKYPTPGQHCRDWPYNNGQSAKALALAEMHEAMTRGAAR